MSSPKSLRPESSAAAQRGGKEHTLADTMREPSVVVPAVVVLDEAHEEVPRKVFVSAKKDLWLSTVDGRHQSPIIPVRCGHEAETFYVHRDILTKSEFFKNALDGRFREADEQAVDLPEEDPALFSFVVAYLYEGKFSPIKPAADALVVELPKGKGKEGEEENEDSEVDSGSEIGNSSSDDSMRSERRFQARQRRQQRHFDRLNRKEFGRHRLGCNCPTCFNNNQRPPCWNCGVQFNRPQPPRRAYGGYVPPGGWGMVPPPPPMGVPPPHPNAIMHRRGPQRPRGGVQRRPSRDREIADPAAEPRMDGEDMRTWLMAYELSVDLFAMEQPSSSSKVTVEYFDPYNVYELLSPGLLARLPLRTLHWESHAGPLRSIRSLHVDLVPAAAARPPSSASSPELSRVKSHDSTTSGDDGFRTQPLGKSSNDREREEGKHATPQGPVKGRRHQIPGLRQTPYLKVLLLRCDDNDTYKAQARKQVREWVKAHTPPAQSTAKLSGQDNHDAFEYLIVHVIVPNTAAATQPRVSAKGGNTIFEKLKADFNGTAKTAVDRVAQIRIGVNDVPYDRLPRVVPAIPGSYVESAQEHEVAWQDLIAKFKKLILDSFDMRVTQYEDDIKEKDAQRALPGWNFCTFFVLKEGLARGFESVGLVEDALVGYDELAVGLDAIIREQAATGTGAEHGGSFLPYTDDLFDQVEQARKKIANGDAVDPTDSDSTVDLQSADNAQKADNDEILLSSDRKPYRELILANNISIFDFRCYLFARQLSLLLRMGNALSSREELLAKLKEQRDTSLLGVAARHPPTQANEENENLALLSEICRRSINFLASISRIMRDDITSALYISKEKNPDAKSSSPEDLATSQAIDNVVSSFTFSITQQILAQTATKALPIPASNLAPINATDGPDQEKATIPEPKTMMHPARSSSLITNPPPRATSPGVFPGRRASSTAVESNASVSSTFLKAGLEDLAAGRAQIYILSRVVLERLGKKRQWSVGWEELQSSNGGTGNMEEVDLDSDSRESPKKLDEGTPSLQGVDNKLLRTALESQDDFNRLYEILTDKALRHFSVAGHTQSVQANMADLAVLRYHLDDYAAAASYLYRITRFYGESGWEQIQMSMLVMYTRCLKELKRNDEYVNKAIILLAKAAGHAKSDHFRKSGVKLGQEDALEALEDVSVDGYLTELMTVVPTLQHDFAVSLKCFFARIEVEGAARYHEGRDSFSIQLKLRYLLPDDLHIDKAKARLVPTMAGQARDIWLDLQEPMDLKPGINRLQFQSNVSIPMDVLWYTLTPPQVTIPGTYVVKQLVLYSSKMVMSYETESAPPAMTQSMDFFKCPRIRLYQRADSFDVKLAASQNLHLDRQRALEITFSSGWNDVASGEIHVRAATAGLRLQTAETKVLDGELEIMKKSSPGVIRFGALPANSTVKLSLPFSLEQETSNLALKVEMSYTVGKEVFFLACSPTILVLLPLGVNVQDVFKRKALFSKFTISSATTNPLRLLSSSLSESDIYEACSGDEFMDSVVIYPRQSASLLYRINRRKAPLIPAGGKKKQVSSLQLKLHYICLEEEIDNAVISAITSSLKDTELYQYTRLIVPAILSVLHSRLSSFDLERAALLGELLTSILLDTNWAAHFSGLHTPPQQTTDVPAQIATWIRAFHAAHPFIPLPPFVITPATIAQSRSITIPVAVPSITVVHTADLQLTTPSPHDADTNTDVGTDSDLVAVTNQPIPATLVLKHTRAWDSPDSPHRDTELAFTYELSAPSDTWLLGGRRKGGFKIPASGAPATLRFPVLLIPLREGYLPFPSLEVKAVPVMRIEEKKGEKKEEGKKEEGKKEEELRVTSECDYGNVAMLVRVFSDAFMTTVSLDASGPQGGAWLLESKRRGE
ncbi:hypothetical protein V493_01355 [Pseudogymnoascus sp. VKM F-4281 (FW-2241)]|nr:hypothetical protein V493_01355 [Pseudogymnoascus sp. VKM F-4281 (FW-2241)]